MVLRGGASSVRKYLALWSEILRYFAVYITILTCYNSLTNFRKSRCLDVVKEEKDLEREAPSVTERFFVTTSRVSRSPPSVDWRVEVESSVSADSSTKKLEVSSKFSWRT